mmetsp:Transcript_32133/g.48513  ORF Transcript_32133/g.48513 Transcript_32133/m.48513 type:complete len:355 (-) Transcript_32133:119-1183(-)
MMDISNNERKSTNSDEMLMEDGKNHGNSATQDASQLPVHQRQRCCDTPKKRKIWLIVAVVLLFVTGVLLAVSIKKVDNTEYGAMYDIHAKRLSDAVRDGGLYIGPPGFEFIKFPSTFVTENLSDTCLSLDGLRVAFDVTFQYQIPEEWLIPAILKYRDFETWAKIVKSAGESAVHHACADFKISSFQNERGKIQQVIEENMRAKLEGVNVTGVDGVYARAISLQLSNVDLPDRYTNAVAEKQSAKEDIALAINQRIQEVTRAETELKAALNQAQKILDTAENDANVTMAQARLKVEETLHAFEKEANTIVNVKESLNLTTEGILGFTANKLLSTVSNLKVTAGEPAKFSQKDEL